MQLAQNGETSEEIVEVHQWPKNASNHIELSTIEENGTSSKRSTRDAWINSDQNISIDNEVPIQNQLKKDILGFIENEIKKSDSVKNPYVFYEHNGPEKDMKTFLKPSGSFKEKRSPSHRKKKKHISSKYREFETPSSGLSALEKVDDYLKQYNKDDVVTLSGDLEIDHEDLDNNNEKTNDQKQRRRGKRRKYDLQNGDVSPKVFHIANAANRSYRPSNLIGVFDRADSLNTPLGEQYIDNPFSSPSSLTSPNEDWFNHSTTNKSNRIYLQRGGTFKAVTRERVFGDASRKSEEQKYFRLGTLTPLDIALIVQRCWYNVASSCHGILAGLAIVHMIFICHSDVNQESHWILHSTATMPYVATYSFFCALCLLSCLDRLDVMSIDTQQGTRTYHQPILLVVIYTACLILSSLMHGLDERISLHQLGISNGTSGNGTSFNDTSELPSAATFATWSHLSILRSVLSILGLVYLVATNPPDLVHANLSKLLQFKHPLQSIG